MLQSCLAVVLWFAVRLGTMKSTFPNLFRRPEDGAAPNRLATLFERFSKTNFFYSTACFLADFHESQCFFIIAVSIALLYANGQPASFNGAENWESLIINQDYINLIASAGALPPILTQLSLHRLGMDSVYGLLCSTVAVLMAGVTLTQLLVLRAEQVWVMFQDKHKQGLDDCGGNLSLRTYCTENPWPGTSRPSMTRILPWLSVLGLLGLLKARSLILERKDRPGPRKGNNSPDQPSSDREGALLALLRKRAGGGFWVSKIGRAMKVILSLCQATLVGFVIYYIAAMGIRSSTDAYSASSTWNVGQVIAVLVWAPVVARYLYTVFCESKTGTQSPRRVLTWTDPMKLVSSEASPYDCMTGLLLPDSRILQVSAWKINSSCQIGPSNKKQNRLHYQAYECLLLSYIFIYLLLENKSR